MLRVTKVFLIAIVAIAITACGSGEDSSSSRGRANNPPVANAGADQMVTGTTHVQLDGTGSSDPDGDKLTYHWTLTAPVESNAILSDDTDPKPSFTADIIDGEYLAELVVNDGTVDSQADSVKIAVKPHYKNKVAFIGGSITAGASASSYEKSWAGLLTTWLNEYYEAGIDAKNIAMGGTTSEYGTFRLLRDLNGFIPDIAFIEYVMNDPAQQDFIYTFVDAIIKKLRTMNPRVNIIYVATTGFYHQSSISKGDEPDGVKFAREISSLNDIHFVNVGQKLWETIMAENVSYTRYLPDGIHPNDDGYEIYYETLVEDLGSYLSSGIEIYKTDSYLQGSGYANAAIEPIGNIKNTDCTMQDNYLVCTTGQSFTFDFDGNYLGFEVKIASDGGQLTCTLDWENSVFVDFWDSYALSYDRKSSIRLFANIYSSSHSIECIANDVILSNPNGSSLGQTTYISGILVNEPEQ